MADRNLLGLSYKVESAMAEAKSDERNHLGILKELSALNDHPNAIESEKKLGIITRLWSTLIKSPRWSKYLQETFYTLIRKTTLAILTPHLHQVDSNFKNELFEHILFCGNLLDPVLEGSFHSCSQVKMLGVEPWGNSHVEWESLLSGRIRFNNTRVQTYLKTEANEIMLARVHFFIIIGCEEHALCLVKHAYRHNCRPCPSRIQKKKEKGNLSLRSNQAALSSLQWFLFLLQRKKTLPEIIKVIEDLSSHEGLQIIRKLRKSSASKPLAFLLIQIFIAQEILEPKVYCCTKQLFKLWCVSMKEMDKNQSQVTEAVKKLFARYAPSSAHFYLLIDVLWEQFGSRCLLLCIELFIRAITVDINHLEVSRSENDKLQTVRIETQLASMLTKLSMLFSDSHDKVSRECVLSAFSLRPSEERLFILQSLTHSILSECSQNNLWNEDLQIAVAGESRYDCKLDLQKSVSKTLHPLLMNAVKNIPYSLRTDLVIVLESVRSNVFKFSHFDWHNVVTELRDYLELFPETMEQSSVESEAESSSEEEESKSPESFEINREETFFDTSSCFNSPSCLKTLSPKTSVSVINDANTGIKSNVSYQRKIDSHQKNNLLDYVQSSPTNIELENRCQTNVQSDKISVSQQQPTPSILSNMLRKYPAAHKHKESEMFAITYSASSLNHPSNQNKSIMPKSAIHSVQHSHPMYETVLKNLLPQTTSSGVIKNVQFPASLFSSITPKTESPITPKTESPITPKTESPIIHHPQLNVMHNIQKRQRMSDDYLGTNAKFVNAQVPLEGLASPEHFASTVKVKESSSNRDSFLQQSWPQQTYPSLRRISLPLAVPEKHSMDSRRAIVYRNIMPQACHPNESHVNSHQKMDENMVEDLSMPRGRVQSPVSSKINIIHSSDRFIDAPQQDHHSVIRHTAQADPLYDSPSLQQMPGIPVSINPVTKIALQQLVKPPNRECPLPVFKINLPNAMNFPGKGVLSANLVIPYNSSNNPSLNQVQVGENSESTITIPGVVVLKRKPVPSDSPASVDTSMPAQVASRPTWTTFRNKHGQIDYRRMDGANALIVSDANAVNKVPLKPKMSTIQSPVAANYSSANKSNTPVFHLPTSINAPPPSSMSSQQSSSLLFPQVEKRHSMVNSHIQQSPLTATGATIAQRLSNQNVVAKSSVFLPHTVTSKQHEVASIASKLHLPVENSTIHVPVVSSHVPAANMTCATVKDRPFVNSSCQQSRMYCSTPVSNMSNDLRVERTSSPASYPLPGAKNWSSPKPATVHKICCSPNERQPCQSCSPFSGHLPACNITSTPTDNINQSNKRPENVPETKESSDNFKSASLEKPEKAKKIRKKPIWKCEICNKFLGSKWTLKTHRIKKHEVKTEIPVETLLMAKELKKTLLESGDIDANESTMDMSLQLENTSDIFSPDESYAGEDLDEKILKYFADFAHCNDPSTNPEDNTESVSLCSKTSFEVEPHQSRIELTDTHGPAVLSPSVVDEQLNSLSHDNNDDNNNNHTKSELQSSWQIAGTAMRYLNDPNYDDDFFSEFQASLGSLTEGESSFYDDSNMMNNKGIYPDESSTQSFHRVKDSYLPVREYPKPGNGSFKNPTYVTENLSSAGDSKLISPSTDNDAVSKSYNNACPVTHISNNSMDNFRGTVNENNNLVQDFKKPFDLSKTNNCNNQNSIAHMSKHANDSVKVDGNTTDSINAKHLKKKVTCEMCKKVLCSTDSRRRHMKNVHKVVFPESPKLANSPKIQSIAQSSQMKNTVSSLTKMLCAKTSGGGSSKLCALLSSPTTIVPSNSVKTISVEYPPNDTKLFETSNNKTLESVYNKLHEPIDNKLHQPIDNKLHQPIDNKLHQPIDNKLHQPIDNKLHQPIDNKFCNPINNKTLEWSNNNNANENSLNKTVSSVDPSIGSPMVGSKKLSAPCTMCEKVFCSNASLRRHLKNVHKCVTDELKEQEKKKETEQECLEKVQNILRRISEETQKNMSENKKVNRQTNKSRSFSRPATPQLSRTVTSTVDPQYCTTSVQTSSVILPPKLPILPRSPSQVIIQNPSVIHTISALQRNLLHLSSELPKSHSVTGQFLKETHSNLPLSCFGTSQSFTSIESKIPVSSPAMNQSSIVKVGNNSPFPSSSLSPPPLSGVPSPANLSDSSLSEPFLTPIRPLSTTANDDSSAHNHTRDLNLINTFPVEQDSSQSCPPWQNVGTPNLQLKKTVLQPSNSGLLNTNPYNVQDDVKPCLLDECTPKTDGILDHIANYFEKMETPPPPSSISASSGNVPMCSFKDSLPVLSNTDLQDTLSSVSDAWAELPNHMQQGQHSDINMSQRNNFSQGLNLVVNKHPAVLVKNVEEPITANNNSRSDTFSRYPSNLPNHEHMTLNTTNIIQQIKAKTTQSHNIPNNVNVSIPMGSGNSKVPHQPVPVISPPFINSVLNGPLQYPSSAYDAVYRKPMPPNDMPTAQRSATLVPSMHDHNELVKMDAVSFKELIMNSQKSAMTLKQTNIAACPDDKLASMSPSCKKIVHSHKTKKIPSTAVKTSGSKRTKSIDQAIQIPQSQGHIVASKSEVVTCNSIPVAQNSALLSTVTSAKSPSHLTSIKHNTINCHSANIIKGNSPNETSINTKCNKLIRTYSVSSATPITRIQKIPSFASPGNTSFISSSENSNKPVSGIVVTNCQKKPKVKLVRLDCKTMETKSVVLPQVDSNKVNVSFVNCRGGKPTVNPKDLLKVSQILSCVKQVTNVQSQAGRIEDITIKKEVIEEEQSSETKTETKNYANQASSQKEANCKKTRPKKALEPPQSRKIKTSVRKCFKEDLQKSRLKGRRRMKKKFDVNFVFRDEILKKYARSPRKRRGNTNVETARLLRAKVNKPERKGRKRKIKIEVPDVPSLALSRDQRKKSENESRDCNQDQKELSISQSLDTPVETIYPDESAGLNENTDQRKRTNRSFKESTEGNCPKLVLKKSMSSNLNDEYYIHANDSKQPNENVPSTKKNYNLSSCVVKLNKLNISKNGEVVLTNSRRSSCKTNKKKEPIKQNMFCESDIIKERIPNVEDMISCKVLIEKLDMTNPVSATNSALRRSNRNVTKRIFFKEKLFVGPKLREAKIPSTPICITLD